MKKITMVIPTYNEELNIPLTLYGLIQADGDCAILMNADLQEPTSAIVELVSKWEMEVKSLKDSLPYLRGLRRSACL